MSQQSQADEDELRLQLFEKLGVLEKQSIWQQQITLLDEHNAKHAAEPHTYAKAYTSSREHIKHLFGAVKPPRCNLENHGFGRPNPQILPPPANVSKSGITVQGSGIQPASACFGHTGKHVLNLVVLGHEQEEEKQE